MERNYESAKLMYNSTGADLLSNPQPICADWKPAKSPVSQHKATMRDRGVRDLARMLASFAK